MVCAAGPGAARRVAFNHILRKAARFPDLFPSSLDGSGLSDRDARLAAAIDREVTTRWLTLRAIIEPHLRQAWHQQHDAVLTALLGGAAQLLLLDRVPDHAAINEAVAWCRTTPARRASGVVNAVLRKIATQRGEPLTEVDPDNPNHLIKRDGTGWAMTTPLASGPPLTVLAAQSGCPVHFLRSLEANLGAAAAHQIALHSIASPPVIVSGAGAHDDLSSHQQPGFQVLRPGGELTGVLTAFPDAVVQDPTAAAACQATGALAPINIVDFCAGKGTKARQLASLHPGARVIASDTSAARMADLQALASSHPRIEATPQKELMEHAGTIDLLLLDVPCTNSGVLARRSEARFRQSESIRTQLRDLQRQIAADALALLKPGGSLVWATCSIDPAENEAQVSWLCQWHQFEVATMRSEVGHGSPGGDPAEWRDGGFFAVLRKPDQQPASSG